MDINVKMESGRFNYRVAAIIERDKKFLMCNEPEDNFFFLPGGRVKLGETAQAALLRELYEELDIAHADISGMPFFVENFFDFAGETYHEIGLFFKIDGKGLALPADGATADGRLFIWRDAIEISQIDLRPKFLKTELGNMPLVTRHIINKSDNLRRNS